jgi:hypothetical protein
MYGYAYISSHHVLQKPQSLWRPYGGIIPFISPRRTPEQPPRGHYCSFGHPVLCISVYSVRGTSWLEPARRRHQRRDTRLVEPQHLERDRHTQRLAQVRSFVFLFLFVVISLFPLDDAFPLLQGLSGPVVDTWAARCSTASGALLAAAAYRHESLTFLRAVYGAMQARSRRDASRVAL